MSATIGRAAVTTTPRIRALASALPPFEFSQETLMAAALVRAFGPDWQASPEAPQMRRLFGATRVGRRRFALDLLTYYNRPRGTAERMATYQTAGLALGREALEGCLRQSEGRVLSDLLLVSCTGYAAPGLDILLARDLGLPGDLRRVCIGHMGCHGALVGLRQALATLRAYPDATVAMLSVELSGLHFSPTRDLEAMTSFALFGDAAVALILANDAEACGPALVDTYNIADFSTAEQMSWTITDSGFIMGLSPRVPITLRRQVRGAVEHLLAPHGLGISDITHWIIHPGGPSILEVIQQRLELSDAQIAPSWRILAERGNCSSATVLLILDDLLRSGATHPGEWGVMMAFGPGLSLELALWRF
ncbi:MAG TPA: type III polyketide synthase [Ktedonobacterales bacterium]|nr:type III polyketide synthase [Ktedonobacterales bacterium]